MTALRVTDASGSVGVLQASDGFGNFLPTNILFNTSSSGLDGGYVLGNDVALFVSGAMGSKDTAIKGVSLFAGDVVVSGTLYAERQVIEVDEVASGHLLVSGTLAVQDSIIANGTQISFLSGGAGASLDETKYLDVNIYFSGTQGSANSAVRGTALFGGDVVISGTLHGGSPLKIAGGMQVAGATAFADPMEFASPPVFQDGFNVSGGSGIFAEAPRFDSGLNVAGGTATFAGTTTFEASPTFEAAPTFEAGFSVTGSTAYDSAPTFDAGFNVAGGQASFTEAPSFSQGFQMTGSGDIGGTINIGDPEDGSFTDGLFVDISRTTLVGTVVDRFNEVLKALAPGPAPTLDDIDYNNVSVSGKLSFGSSNAVLSYTNTNITAGFSSVDKNGAYGNGASGNNLRIGLLNGSTAVTGDLNEDVTSDTHASSQVNYPANAFGSADQGTLSLEVNGSVLHSVALSTFLGSGVPGSGGGSSVGGNGSGFIILSKTGSANFSDGTDLDLFQHRTGRYTIAAANQRLGWNYARVRHVVGTTTYTNYIEWVNDTDNNSLSLSSSTLSNLSMSGNVTLSGVKYYTAGTATYAASVLNAYKNVYSSNNISFTTSNCSASSQSFPSIGAGEDHTKTLSVSANAAINVNSLLNEAIAVSINVPHPLKTNLTSAGSQSINNILLWAHSNNSTAQSENFRHEAYRLKSGNYNSQSDVSNNSNVWDSSISIAGATAGYTDGLMFYNSRLYAPRMGANSGNFSAITNAPGSNVNYSGINSGERAFYRYFQNNSGGSKTGFSLVINGSGTIIANGSSLSTSNFKVYVKLPSTSSSQSTGWMDLGTAFSTGQVGDNAGCLAGSLDNSLNATNTVTFGTQFVAANEYVMIKIKAAASFTGYLSNITVSWP